MSVPYIRAGSEVTFRINVYNQRVDPPVLASPAQGAKITVTDMNDVDVVTLADMVEESTGVFTYQLQTTMVADDFPVGAYTVSYKTQDGSSIHEEVVAEAFVLVNTRIT